MARAYLLFTPLPRPELAERAARHTMGPARPPRPSWLPSLPLGYGPIVDHGSHTHAHNRTRRRIRYTLCSVAIGEPYESHLDQLRTSAAPAGFDRVMLWKRADVLADPLLNHSTIGAAFQVMHAFFRRYHHKKGTGHFSARPFCAAFKPVIMWRALVTSSPGDYVLWADASQYTRNVTLLGGLQQAIALLTGRTPRPPPPNVTGRRWQQTPWFKAHARDGWTNLAVRSVYGLLTCSAWDCAADLYTWNGQDKAIEGVTLTDYADFIDASDALMQRPLILNSNILLENTHDNRLLVWDWLHMAVRRPEGFCWSHPQDQSAWTILVLNRSLPLVNVCPYRHGKGAVTCVNKQKNTNELIDTLQRGAFEVVLPDEVDWLREGYSRNPQGVLPSGKGPNFMATAKKTVQGCVRC